MKRQLLAVEVHLVFGLVIAAADVDFGHAFYVQQFALQAGGNAVGFFHTVAIYLEIGGCLGRHTRITTAENNLCLTEFGISLQVFAHFLADCLQRNITVCRIYQTDIEGNDVRTVVLHGSPGIIRIGLPYGIVAYLHDTLILLQPLIGKFLRNLLRHFFTRTDRQLQLYGNTGIVLRREELRTNGLCTEQAQDKEYHTTDKHDHTMTHRPVEHTCIPVVQAIQCVLYRPEEYPEHFGLFTLQAEQLRTEHRRQRQSRNGGYKHNGAHHPAQLLEQHAGHTGYHSQREEYGNHRQRRSHYGNSHLVRSVNCCLLRVGTALDMCRDILQHHNGIVHHHTDGYGE